MNTAELIKRRTYRVAGTDCAIWVGDYSNKHPEGGRRLCFVSDGHGLVNVRAWLFGKPHHNGFSWTTPVCGNGRCLTPDHQATSKRPEVTAGE